MNKKGFTLVELLATIVILGLLATISIPQVTRMIDKANKAADIDSAIGYVKAAEQYYNDTLLNEGKPTSAVNINIIDKVDISNAKATGFLYLNKAGDVYMAIKINGKCYVKEFNQETNEITMSADTALCDSDHSGI